MGNSGGTSHRDKPDLLKGLSQRPCGRTLRNKCTHRAVSAVSIHRRRALTQLQNSPDPGEGWLVEHGELVESALDWMIKAYPKLPDRDKISKLEEVFRAVEHVGKPVEHMDHTVVDSHMGDLPEPLRDTMKNGVRTGIPRPEETNQAKATNTAVANFEKVAKEMRNGTVHGWMRAIPPSRRDMLVKWVILLSDVHYVEPPNDRVVADLTGSGANESSPESEHGYAKERVQCDYVDVVVEEMVLYVDLVSMFSDGELVSIKADIKSAFMRIIIHLDSMGTFAMEWDGWIFIFNRTCFGWKYATHTFFRFYESN